MSAIYSAGTAGSEKVARIAFLLLAMIPLLSHSTTPPQEGIAAVWKAREIGFFYRSSANPYPCHELKNVVTNILLAVGARDDLQVSVSDCDYVVTPRDSDFDPFDRFGNPSDRFRNRDPQREQSSHVRIRLMAPVELTPEVLKEIDKDKSRRELISRVTGDKTVGQNDPIVFAAQRQSVTLSRSSIRLEPQHCQLLEQIARSVFQELGVRVVKRNFTCDSQQTSRITPQITVEALMPTGALIPLPEPGHSQREPTIPETPETPPAEVAPETPPE